MRGDSPWPDCGTPAAARAHYRRGEKPCGACLKANRRQMADSRGQHPGTRSADLRPVRNGLPEVPGYEWRARAYPWARQVLAAAEAVHGRPYGGG